MNQQYPTIQQAIDYLYRVDRSEHWRADISWAPSPEDWGLICLSKLAEVENPDLEVIGALVFAALTDEQERIRTASAEQLAILDPRLATIIFYIHTFDSDDWVVDPALACLCNDSKGDRTLAKLACERLEKHANQSLRKLASTYKQSIADDS